MFNLKDNKTELFFFGLGGLVASSFFIKSASALGLLEGNERTFRKSKIPKAIDTDIAAFSNPDNAIPSMVVVFDEDSEEYVPKKLNFTPRRASTKHKESQHNDLQFLVDPFVTPQEFKSLKDPSKMIHPNDYLLLQQQGIIPLNFPLSRTQYVKSLDGINEFIVGYSRPFNLKTKRDDLQVIRPIWAVSFGKNFNTRSEMPSGFAPSESQFKDLISRMLFAEFMLSQSDRLGVEGCHPNQPLSECNMERLALVSALVTRAKRKSERTGRPLKYEEVILGPNQRWNAGGSFMSTFNGYAGTTNNANSPKKDIPDFAKRRFERFYNTNLWNMPQLAHNATHFIHFNSMTPVGDNPDFIKSGDPLKDDLDSFPAQNTVKIGRSVFTDRRKFFK
jgi:hypothetical protein